jgi:hypothetical protein
VTSARAGTCDALTVSVLQRPIFYPTTTTDGTHCVRVVHTGAATLQRHGARPGRQQERTHLSLQVSESLRQLLGLLGRPSTNQNPLALHLKDWTLLSLTSRFLVRDKSARKGDFANSAKKGDFALREREEGSEHSADGENSSYHEEEDSVLPLTKKKGQNLSWGFEGH